VAQKFRETLN